jgi:carboxymethylenebutenolidase
MGDVTLSTSGGTLRGYLAEPHHRGPAPGVLVLHEAYGMNDDIKAHADRLAAAGYLALAPDLYSWGAKLRCVAATMVAMARRQGRAFADIEACRSWLAQHESCTGTVGVIGFCMGGGLAIACAPRGGFAVAAPNYGLVPKDAETVLAGACPMVASYGADDPYMKGASKKLSSALDALGVPNDVKEYADTSHSFLNHHDGLAAGIDRIMHMGFRPEAADDAWQRILAFFSDYLGDGAPGGGDTPVVNPPTGGPPAA